MIQRNVLRKNIRSMDFLIGEGLPVTEIHGKLSIKYRKLYYNGVSTNVLCKIQEWNDGL